MKILINALSGNGDALMFSPSLKVIRDKIPDAEIDMLVMFRSVKEMYMHSPYLSEIHFIDFLKQSKFQSLAQVRKLKQKEYDVSINVYPSNRFEYNLVNALLGAKKKIAHAYTHTNFFRAEFFNDVLVNEISNRHNVLQNLDLVKQFTEASDSDAGAMELFISDEDKSSAQDWCRRVNPENRTLVGFHAGSALLKNHIHKRWAKEKFAALGKKLRDKHNALILLFGNEFDLNNEINAMMNENGIIASTENYMDSLARQSLCNLFISNDTAFLHTAAALQVPVAGIFAYTNAKELYPWKAPHIVVRKEIDCSPCFYNSPSPASCIFSGDESFKCMTTISVDEVYSAAAKLLSESSLH